MNAREEQITAEIVQAPATVDVYVLMCRYSEKHWSALSTYASAESAAEYANTIKNITAWRIIKVSGLPINIPGGQV